MALALVTSVAVVERIISLTFRASLIVAGLYIVMILACRDSNNIYDFNGSEDSYCGFVNYGTISFVDSWHNFTGASCLSSG